MDAQPARDEALPLPRPRGDGATTLSERIVAEVKAALFDRRIGPGDHLGSEATIAQRFGVSRMAARDAIRALVAQGIATVRKGPSGGVRIATGDPDRFAESLAVQLRLLGVELSDLIEAQIAAEAATAELAAQRASEDEVEGLRAILLHAADHVDDPARFMEEIVAFHTGLARAAGNVVLATFLQGVLRVLIDTYGRNTTAERAQSVLRSYQAVIDAVWRHDGEAARVLMRTHLGQAYASLAAAGALARTRSAQ
ncbi:FCD domain-containing protein [Sphingosinicella sp. LHD-64]|uniref:FadR/GntR family transcriptional regulator n=1 Tax=Sphingosinicella sp. LHD-64 TaxID=3072139 RepID=UPI00280F9D84|nr:FCD domain-containing protein [Sphingosinicella sp. LHD-64]MDQ8756521.1 FCD domain-containing protein [Sphingosinicella sp. LHD-64]